MSSVSVCSHSPPSHSPHYHSHPPLKPIQSITSHYTDSDESEESRSHEEASTLYGIRVRRHGDQSVGRSDEGT